MMNAIKPSFREFGHGTLLLGDDGKIVKYFKYSIVTESEKQFNKPIRNLISSQDSMVVRTSWDLPFKTNQQVFLNNEMFMIMRCGRLVTDINEQSLGLLKASNSAFWVVEVTR